MRWFAGLYALAVLTMAVPVSGQSAFETLTITLYNGPASIAFSPNGSIMATCDDSGVVTLWDPATGEIKLRLTGHQGAVRSVAFSRDGSTLASAGFDGTIRLWDPVTGKPKQTIQDTAYTYFPSFSKSGKSLATGSWENEPRIWNLETGKLRFKLPGHTGTAWAAAFSPSGLLVATGGRDAKVIIWDAPTGKRLRTLVGHTAGVTAVTFSPDDATIAGAGADGMVRLWDVRTGDCRLTIYAHKGAVVDAAFSPDGRTLATAGSDEAVRLWDAGTGEMQKVLYLIGLCVAFSPDGKRFAAGGGARVTLWDWAGLQAAIRTKKGRADLRPNFTKWGLPPRFQGERGLCSVYTVVDAIGYALAKRKGGGELTSVEYLNWAANQTSGYQKDGQFFEDAIKGFNAHGVCLERYMPCQPKFDPKLQPSEEARRNAEEIRSIGLKHHFLEDRVDGPRPADGYIPQIKAVLDMGYPLCAGAGHSILLVGYQDDPEQPGGGIFIARDSGAGWYTEPTYAFIRQRTGGFHWFE